MKKGLVRRFAGFLFKKLHSAIEQGKALAVTMVDGEGEDWPGEKHIPKGMNDELVNLMDAAAIEIERRAIEWLADEGWITYKEAVDRMPSHPVTAGRVL